METTRRTTNGATRPLSVQSTLRRDEPIPPSRRSPREMPAFAGDTRASWDARERLPRSEDTTDRSDPCANRGTSGRATPSNGGTTDRLVRRPTVPVRGTWGCVV